MMVETFRVPGVRTVIGDRLEGGTIVPSFPPQTPPSFLLSPPAGRRERL
jgi:hypothetical protein